MRMQTTVTKLNILYLLQQKMVKPMAIALRIYIQRNNHTQQAQEDKKKNKNNILSIRNK